MGLDRGAIKDLCDAALGAIVNYWPGPGDAAPLPARRHVANGEAYWDCEMLCVACERIYGNLGEVGAEQWEQHVAFRGVRAITLAVWLIRCVPDMEGEGDTVAVPTAPAIDASAAVILGDSVTVWELLNDAQGRGDLATCNGLAFQDWTPAGPVGGFGGGVTRTRVQVL